MQSVIRCTHYVAGASEQHYINKTDDPREIHGAHRNFDSGKAYTTHDGIGAAQNWDCMFPLIGGMEFWRPPRSELLARS